MQHEPTGSALKIELPLVCLTNQIKLRSPKAVAQQFQELLMASAIDGRGDSFGSRKGLKNTTL
jgi:hypothetical protein